MSGMVTAQSAIARDLNAYDSAMWFTSAYLIAMSSLGPIMGRLASIFSPRAMVPTSTFFFTIGALVTSQARSLAVFVLGRVISGVGAAVMLTLSAILVLALSPVSKRGTMFGLLNLGFTVGVSFGAVTFGAAVPAIGWVRV